MTRRTSQRRSPVRIELTALVDVVLLLLIFFMVSARLTPDFAFELDLPDAQAADAVESESRDLRVQVDAENRYLLSGEHVSIDTLEQAFSQADADQVLVVQADRHASHGAVVGVLDAAQVAGLESVRVATERGTGDTDE